MLEFALDRGVTFISACKYAGINPQYAYSLGYKANKTNKHRLHSLITKMRIDGYGLKIIAELTGLSEGYLCNYLKKHKVKKTNPIELHKKQSNLTVLLHSYYYQYLD